MRFSQRLCTVYGLISLLNMLFLHTKPRAVFRFEEQWRLDRPLWAGRRYMDKKGKIKPIRITASVTDDTFYVIEYATSENAKETAYEKIKRLIMNEPITLEKEAS